MLLDFPLYHPDQSVFLERLAYRLGQSLWYHRCPVCLEFLKEYLEQLQVRLVLLDFPAFHLDQLVILERLVCRLDQSLRYHRCPVCLEFLKEYLEQL